MKIQITIETDNAAFEDDPSELARILETVAAKTEGLEPGEKANLRDINGNTVGTVRIEDEDAEPAAPLRPSSDGLTIGAREELAELEADFERAGGRGVELADRIDALREELGEDLQGRE